MKTRYFLVAYTYTHSYDRQGFGNLFSIGNKYPNHYQVYVDIYKQHPESIISIINIIEMSEEDYLQFIHKDE